MFYLQGLIRSYFLAIQLRFVMILVYHAAFQASFSTSLENYNFDFNLMLVCLENRYSPSTCVYTAELRNSRRTSIAGKVASIVGIKAQFRVIRTVLFVIRKIEHIGPYKQN